MSGLGSMMAGGVTPAGREEDDFYGTPIEATIGLLLAEQFNGVIWECAAGNGAIAKVLQAQGHKVISTDINSRGFSQIRNFLEVPARGPWSGNIVTNPPFNLAREFIEHAMLFRPRKLALLLKSSFWHAKERTELFNRWRPARKYELTWRLDFKGQGRPTMECAWFVWERESAPEMVTRLMSKPVVAAASEMLLAA